jgi:hypothetical protein
MESASSNAHCANHHHPHVGVSGLCPVRWVNRVDGVPVDVVLVDRRGDCSIDGWRIRLLIGRARTPLSRNPWYAPTVGTKAGRILMRAHISRPMSFSTAATLGSTVLFVYAAWLTSIVFSASHDHRPLLIAAAAFFPVGVVHGVGVWFGGW